MGRTKDPGAYSGGRYKKLLPHKRTRPWRSWSLRLSLLGCIMWAVTWPTLRLRFTLCSVDWLEVLLKVRDHQFRLGAIPSDCSKRQECSSSTSPWLACIVSDVPQRSQAGRGPADARHAFVRSAKKNRWLERIVRTFFANLLYSSTKSSRFAISSLSDIKSPLFEVQVALL